LELISEELKKKTVCW